MLHKREALGITASLRLVDSTALAALKFFDYLGLILYRGDSPHLSDFVFMVPQQLIDGLRCVIAPEREPHKKQIQAIGKPPAGHYTMATGEALMRRYV